jgi:hypothetical protein
MSSHLPKKDNCSIQREKIVSYILNKNHEIGKSKAQFFTSFGFSIDCPEILQDALVEHGKNRPVVKTRDDGYGPKYTVQCTISTPSGEKPCIETVWILETGSESPRFVTAYPSHVGAR